MNMTTTKLVHDELDILSSMKNTGLNHGETHMASLAIRLDLMTAEEAVARQLRLKKDGEVVVAKSTINRFKTSDIKIHKDSQGCYECTHTYQGVLIDFNFYNDRNEARRAAVNVLMEIKEGSE